METAARAAVEAPRGASRRLWETSVGSDRAFLLARANALSLQRTKVALGPLGLSARTFTVLTLASEGARPTQRELSDFLQLDPSQIVALIDELESRGLVRREPDPQDRRAKVLLATPDGVSLAGAARLAIAESEAAWVAGVDSETLSGFDRAIALLASREQDEPAGP